MCLFWIYGGGTVSTLIFSILLLPFFSCRTLRFPLPPLIPITTEHGNRCLSFPCALIFPSHDNSQNLPPRARPTLNSLPCVQSLKKHVSFRIFTLMVELFFLAVILSHSPACCPLLCSETFFCMVLFYIEVWVVIVWEVQQ